MQIQADTIAYDTDAKEITASRHVVIVMKDGSVVEAEKAVVKTSGKESTIVAKGKVRATKTTDQNK